MLAPGVVSQAGASQGLGQASGPMGSKDVAEAIVAQAGLIAVMATDRLGQALRNPTR